MRNGVNGMSTAKKAEIVDELAQILANSDIILATDYRGLSVGEMTKVRRQLQQQGMKYMVVKNTLTRLAAERVGKAALGAVLQGPTALALGRGDASASAKALTDYVRAGKTKLAIKGGVLGVRSLSAQDVNTLATLPPREVLVSRVMGQLQAPIQRLLGVLSAPLRGLGAVLKARQEQLEKASSA